MGLRSRYLVRVASLQPLPSILALIHTPSSTEQAHAWAAKMFASRLAYLLPNCTHVKLWKYLWVMLKFMVSMWDLPCIIKFEDHLHKHWAVHHLWIYQLWNTWFMPPLPWILCTQQDVQSLWGDAWQVSNWSFICPTSKADELKDLNYSYSNFHLFSGWNVMKALECFITNELN